jgi:hypothetical protein
MTQVPGRKIEKTSIQRNTDEPVWNHEIVFDCEKRKDQTLTIQLSDSNLIGKDDVIAEFSLPISEYHRPMDQWYPMRPLNPENRSPFLDLCLSVNRLIVPILSSDSILNLSQTVSYPVRLDSSLSDQSRMRQIGRFASQALKQGEILDERPRLETHCVFSVDVTRYGYIVLC